MFGDVVAEVPCHSDQMHQTANRFSFGFVVEMAEGANGFGQGSSEHDTNS